MRRVAMSLGNFAKTPHNKTCRVLSRKKGHSGDLAKWSEVLFQEASCRVSLRTTSRQVKSRIVLFLQRKMWAAHMKNKDSIAHITHNMQ